MSTWRGFTVFLQNKKSFIRIMKTIITLCLVLIGSMSFAQKAKSTGINCKYHHMRYPENVDLSAKLWALSVTEQTACQGAIKYAQRHTPLIALDKRSQYYMSLVGNKGKYYYQAKTLISNLDAQQTPYIHFELETRDINIISQATKNKKPGADPKYNLIFEMRTPVILKATRRGDMNVELLDTNNFSAKSYWFAFPEDAQLGTGVDIKPNGYPNEAELLAAWRKYGKKAELQWRDKMITGFLRYVFANFTDTYIQHEEWDVIKVYSDKNKKGGYDEIVDAAELFSNTFDEIDTDYKAGKMDKFYTQEYQKRFTQCSETWKAFLAKYDFDVSSKDGDVSDSYKQDILLNYVYSLILTKQFDEAEKQIAIYLTQEIRGGTRSDLKMLRRLSKQFQTEYLSNAERMGWK